MSNAAHALCLGPPREVYVGDTSSDSSCTYNDIQSALNAEGSVCPVNVNITREHTYTNQALTISGKKLVLKGWGDGVTCNLLKNCTTVGCLPAETGAPLVTLSGGVGNSVLHIDGSSGVTLYDLTISGGILNPQQGGGGVYFGGTGSLYLENTTVSNNQAGYGAGIAMSPSGSATLTLGPNTVIQYNDATVNGGGLLIEGLTYMQAMSTNLYINGNTALSGDGGGLIVIAPATADIGSPGFFGLPAINGNSAAYGGGIAAEGSQSPPFDGRVRLFTTDPAHPVTIANNTASHTGGGIYLKPILGDTSNIEFLCAYDFRVDDNSAVEGAGIYSDEQHDTGQSDYVGGTLYLNLDASEDTSNVCNRTELLSTSFGGVPCAAGVACNEIAGNIAQDTDGTPTAGAAVLMQSGSTFVGDRFAVRGNTGGSAIHMLTDGDFALMQIHNCLIVDNTVSAELIDATPGGGDQNKVGIDNCTLAGNTIGAPYVMLVQLSNSSDFALTDNLIAQPGRATVDYDGSLDLFTIEYDVSNDISTLSAGVGVKSGTPTFVDAANGDYHLQRTSFGVNYAPPGTTGHDLDGNTRVVNLPGVADVYGAMDVGAYEIQLACAVSDTIFCDGFGG